MSENLSKVPTWLAVILPLMGVAVAGGLAIFNSILTERRRRRNDLEDSDQRGRVLLTGLHAIRNFIVEQLNRWDETGLASDLAPLKTAKSYLDRIIDKAPVEGEHLINTLMDLGLRLDALLQELANTETSTTALKKRAKIITDRVAELAASLELFDIVTKGALTFLTEEDLERFSRWPERGADEAS